MKIDTMQAMIQREAPMSQAPIPASVRLERATPERLEKGQQFRLDGSVQRIVGSLSALSKAGEIDQAHHAAAERWYRDYVMGVVGARDPEARKSGRAPDIHAAMLARTAAVTRCRGVRNALGLCGEIRFKLLLIDELSFSAIAVKLFPGDVNGRKKIAAQVMFLLEQLVEHYAAIDLQRPVRVLPTA